MLGERRVIINGLPYIARDIGCPDFSRARLNREIVKKKLFIEWWQAMESALSRTPKGAPFPSIVRIGRIPEHRPPKRSGFSQPFEDEEEDRQG